MFQVTFRRKWESAHRFVENQSEKCSIPHGHTWNVEVTVSFPTDQLEKGKNLAVPFEEIKGIWHEWIDEKVDHSYMCNQKDPLNQELLGEKRGAQLLVTPGDPTTEILCVLFKSKFEAFLQNSHLTCNRVKIYETGTNAVSFNGNPADILPDDKKFWWNRADMTINDLESN